MEKTFFEKLKALFNKSNQNIEPDPMKYLIVGLGNMGAKYDGTRHNIGFDVVDKLAEMKKTEWKDDHLGDLATFKHRSRTFVLLKPSTFMNLSGKAVRYWMQKEKINKENILIVLDDLNLPYGKLRLRGKGNDGGHNGLKDIDRMINGNNYPRLRLGIGDEYSKGRQVDFVLGEWSNEEKEHFDGFIDTAAKAVLSFGSIGLGHTMTEYNKK